jgi:hypothetical protein
MKESTNEKTSKSGVSSSDLAVEYDDERAVKNDGRLVRRHGSDDSTRRTSCGSTEVQLKLWLKKEKNTHLVATSHLSHYIQIYCKRRTFVTQRVPYSGQP